LRSVDDSALASTLNTAPQGGALIRFRFWRGADRAAAPATRISSASWRAQVEDRARDLEGELAVARAEVKSKSGDNKASGLSGRRSIEDASSWPKSRLENFGIAQRNIEVARDAVTQRSRNLPSSLKHWASGSQVETAWRALHAAESALLMVASQDSVEARLPEMRASLTTTLGESDGRVPEYSKVLDESSGHVDANRNKLRVIKSAIDAASDAAHSNVRNYRNWLLIVALVVTAGLIGVAIAHAFDSDFIDIKVGQASADVAQLEAAGATGGLLMALFALIRLKVYSGPYALPLWQALIRVPSGAAAALVGTILLQGNLLSSLAAQTDMSALLGYATLFGAAPEILLRFLDKQVNSVSAAARTKNDPLKQVPKQTTGPET
jgi:hypothetical protein